jgi:hypothetical protein
LLETGESARLTEEDEDEVSSQDELDSRFQLFSVDASSHELISGRYELHFSGGQSSLVIHNVTTDDIGLYVCAVSNGIGRSANVTNQLVVRHAPIMRLFPSVTKSASDSGSVGRLVCRVTAAPDVKFTWFKGEQLLASESSKGNVVLPSIPTAVEHPSGSGSLTHLTSIGQSLSSLSSSSSISSISLAEKFTLFGIRRIGLATFESTLLIQDVHPLDYGLYTCRAQNTFGSSSAEIRFTKPSRPDRPISLRAMNRTAVSITVRWIAAFDGGLSQRFRLRFKSAYASYLKSSSNAGHSYLDIESSDARDYTVTGLQPGTEYLFSIQAINELGESDYTNDLLRESTLDGKQRLVKTCG